MSSGVFEALGWLNTLFHALLVLAFVVVCFVKARAIGMAGASILAVLGLLDMTGVCLFRVGLLSLKASHASYTTMESFFSVIGGVNLLLNVVSIALAVTAFVLLRKAPAARAP